MRSIRQKHHNLIRMSEAEALPHLLFKHVRINAAVVQAGSTKLKRGTFCPYIARQGRKLNLLGLKALQSRKAVITLKGMIREIGDQEDPYPGQPGLAQMT